MISKRLIPLAVLVALIAAAFAFRVDKYLALDALRDNRAALLAFVDANRFLAAAVYIGIYAAVVALSVPGAAIMTLAGGFLFGIPIGATLTIIGATLGATLLFLIARSAAGDFLRKRAGPFLARLSEGFSKDAFNYLLFLRLVPVVPFWAANLAPALFGMGLVSFVVATALGIIPGTVVFTSFGAGLGEVFDAGAAVDLKSVFSPKLIAALVGLGLLALLPVVLKRWRGKSA